MSQYHSFPLTHWSLVRRAGASDEASRREALAQLLSRYQPAMRSYLRVVRRMNSADADDVLQGFIADRVLEQQLIARADPSRGRFRTLLLTCLNNFVIDRLRASQRQPSGPLENQTVPNDDAPSPHAQVEADWVRALLRGVLEAMRNECQASGRRDIWRVFEARVLSEIFGTTGPVSYESLAQELQLQTPTQAANLLVTAKRMYGRLLRAAVSEYEPEAEAVDAEIAELRRILAAAGLAEHTDDSHELD